MMRSLIAGALAFAAVGPALAADLPQPMPPPPQMPATYIPTVIPVYNWGGVYYGINGGYAFGKSNWTDPNNPFAASTGDFNISGGLVGATVGANMQFNAFVFGVEADFDAAWIKGTTTGTFCPITCETKDTWLGTARARFGYAADRLLFYGTGGLAFGNILAGINGGFDNSTKAGWTAGAGIEAALADNWTARIEYLFVELERGSCTTALNCSFDAPGIAATDSVKFQTSLIRAGLMYKFR